MRRSFILLGIDLFWIAISPFLALLIRDNFAPRAEAFAATLEYAGVGVLVGLILLPLGRFNRDLWRYTSLPDLVRLIGAVTAIILLSLFIYFGVARLQDIARSLPVIQWFVLLACMGGNRLAIRIWQERRSASAKQRLFTGKAQTVLLVGVGDVAELYLRSVAEFAPRRISVAGILASGAELSGRLLRSHKVLGQPQDVQQIVKRLEIHGEFVDRIVVAEPAGRLSPDALTALLTLERSSAITVDWLTELLGFEPAQSNEVQAEAPPFVVADLSQPKRTELPLRNYGRPKRIFDLLAATVVILIFTPVGALLAILIALDDGFPVVFWQKRPGRNGVPFKLYKFRTMRGAHDRMGNRINDAKRSSKLGGWLRRNRLDELPQLYNILVGEMSFVGPRPLLPCDQPADATLRLGVRPGLTGLAQIYGGSTMPPNDKNRLDIWYIQNASLWLDLNILLRTTLACLRGQHIEGGALDAARLDLKRFGEPVTIGRFVTRETAPGSAKLIN